MKEGLTIPFIALILFNLPSLRLKLIHVHHLKQDQCLKQRHQLQIQQLLKTHQQTLIPLVTRVQFR